MKKMMSLDSFLTEYIERNDNNQYIPVAVGRYGIRKREDIYSKELAKDYSKNKLIFKDTLTVGMGSVQMDIGVLVEQEIYSVSPAYHTYRIASIDSSYLKYCLECRNMDMFSRYVKRGSRQGKSIDLKRWLTYEIPVCSEEEQRRIVGKIDFVERLIVNLNQEIKLMDDIVKSRFVEMFGNPVRNPKGWKTCKLEDCLERIDNGKSFVCSDKARTDDYPAVLKLSAATYGDYRPYENKALLNEKMFVESAEVHKGDLLFTRKNTPELVGMAAYVLETPANLMMPDLIFRLVPNEKMDSMFLWQLINCREFRPVIQSVSGGSAKSMSNISKERLGKIPVICPPRELQDELIPFIQQTDKSKLAVQKELEKLEILKKSLMQQYFG